MIASGVREAKVCEKCPSCDGIVCREQAGAAVARYYPIEGIIISSRRTEKGCVVNVKKERTEEK